MGRLVPRIYSARAGFDELGRAHEQVEMAEGAVFEARKKLEEAEQKLLAKREAFDHIRQETMKHCPALEDGYKDAGLTETVAIVDGKVTVVPIASVQREFATAEEKDPYPEEAAG